MRPFSTLASLGLLLGAQLASAASLAAAALPTIPYEKYRLGNGLEVILAQDRSLPIVAVNLWYHVGAANEEPGRTGFAHLYEHMMFTGTKHIKRGVADELLAAAGVSDSNATTSFDRTNYFDTAAVEPTRTARCGRTRTGWATCSIRWTRLRCPTSRTSCATNAASRPKTGRTASSTKRRFMRCSRRDIRTAPRSSVRTWTFRQRALPTCAIFSSVTTARTTPRWSSAVISRRRPPNGWCKSNSARSTAVPKVPPPRSRRHPCSPSNASP